MMDHYASLSLSLTIRWNSGEDKAHLFHPDPRYVVYNAIKEETHLINYEVNPPYEII
jgi:hypothetical protein